MSRRRLRPKRSARRVYRPGVYLVHSLCILNKSRKAQDNKTVSFIHIMYTGIQIQVEQKR